MENIMELSYLRFKGYNHVLGGVIHNDHIIHVTIR